MAKFAKVPGLGDVGGGEVNPILAMPAFWVHMDLQPVPRSRYKNGQLWEYKNKIHHI